MAKIQHGRDLTGEQMGQILDEFVNGSASREEIAAFVEQVTRRTHRTLQQKIMGLFVATVEAWAENKGGSDARNEATVKLAKKMIDATGDKYDRALPYI
jgi:anthranilate phosphoribosyltransferase